MSHYLTLKKIGQAVAYYPNLTRKLGNVNASILLSQFIYWHDKTNNSLGVYKTQVEIHSETGLSRKEQETGRKILRELGLVTETYKRTEHKLYFLFHPEKFDKWFDGEAMSESDIRECTKVTVPMSESDIPPMSESDIRYIHKNTKENTTRESHTLAQNPTIEKPVQQEGQSLVFDGEKIKSKFAMAGLLPLDNNLVLNTDKFNQELYAFNEYYSYLYMDERQAYSKLIGWFKNIDKRGGMAEFYNLPQANVTAPVTQGFAETVPTKTDPKVLEMIAKAKAKRPKLDPAFGLSEVSL